MKEIYDEKSIDSKQNNRLVNYYILKIEFSHLQLILLYNEKVAYYALILPLFF